MLDIAFIQPYSPIAVAAKRIEACHPASCVHDCPNATPHCSGSARRHLNDSHAASTPLRCLVAIAVCSTVSPSPDRTSTMVTDDPSPSPYAPTPALNRHVALPRIVTCSLRYGTISSDTPSPLNDGRAQTIVAVTIDGAMNSPEPPTTSPTRLHL